MNPGFAPTPQKASSLELKNMVMPIIEYVFDDHSKINVLRLDLKLIFLELHFSCYIKLFNFKPDHELVLWLTTAHPWLIKHLSNYHQFWYLKKWLLFENEQWLNPFKPEIPYKYIIPEACWNLPHLSDEEYYRRFELDK